MGPKRKFVENKENDLSSSAKKNKSFDEENSDDDVICLDVENKDIERSASNNLTPQRLADLSNKPNVLAAKTPIGEKQKTQPIEASANEVEHKTQNFNVQAGMVLLT